MQVKLALKKHCISYHSVEKAFLLKKLDKRRQLPDNSTDIESDNVIKVIKGDQNN